MKFRMARSNFTALLPCVGIVAFSAMTVFADPPERVGSDAPHQERNEAKNEKKTALSLSEVTVPESFDKQKPVRKATAVKAETATRKSKDKKKAERQAKEKTKTEATVVDTVQDRSNYYDPDADDRVGSGAPHQERGSSDRRGARLFILER